MQPFAIAGIQMYVGAHEENITAMGHRLDLAVARFPWVQMVMFSELAPYGPLPHHATDLPGAAEEAFQEMARKHGVWLLPGSMFEKVGDTIYNTASVINPHGEVVGRYRKMFPFRPYEAGIEAGTEFLTFDVPEVGRFGVSICYDIWFPETTRTLSAMGAEVILHPVLTGTIDREIETVIARSSAAMFQSYIFDINGLGAGGCGRSCVVDPSGTVLYQAAGQEEIIPIEIDLAQVRRQRETGLKGLGQTLKSFRDRDVDFAVYDRQRFDGTYLNHLGALEMPARGSRAGLGAPRPGTLEPGYSTPLAEPAGAGAPHGGLSGWIGQRLRNTSG
ncbi:carbon-nitrogen hydrolase family protein [Marivibrio halodurans]|uniref:Carbon-nitrogen hydrolase family protein n=1 Tax=Marivibrio halodurans TaxID=2039722 RepID=A0A8J7SPW5_9PROT|nr:carbon-nitrogen hydrolase family protein [Marivibrio halodurans]MBP5858888.1 carbon-nitrogen hydrolase family protein [Marivibrio halodurans]